MIKLDADYEPVIVAAARTAVGKAKRGSLATTRPDEMAAEVIKELLRRAVALDPADIDDVILGSAFPEGEQGLNMARLVALRAGLPDSVPAETINSFCSSGLQSIAHGAFAIMAWQARVVVAGGAESMSMVPMTGFKFSPMPFLAEQYPAAFTNMGLTAENVSAKYGVNRADQDAFALRSHHRAHAAVETGRFDPEIVPLEVEIVQPGGNGNLPGRAAGRGSAGWRGRRGAGPRAPEPGRVAPSGRPGPAGRAARPRARGFGLTSTRFAAAGPWPPARTSRRIRSLVRRLQSVQAASSS